MRNVIAVCAVVLMLSSMASATITVDMFSAGAPNVFGSASYAPWWSNAQAAIRGGLTNQGSGNSEYIQLSNTGGISADQPGYQGVTSGFDSWQGVAGGTGELGTRIHFIYSIKATEGESLSLANISGVDVLENGWGDTDYSIFTSFYGAPVSMDSSTTFDINKRVGFKADGTVVTSGNDMTDIVEIIGNFGMSYAAYFPDTWYGGATAQEELSLTIADLDANLQSWKAVLTYSGTTVNTTVNFVPEPMTLALLGLGGLMLRRKK